MNQMLVSSVFVLLTALDAAAGVHRVSMTALDAETGRPLPGLAAGVAFNNTLPLSFTSRWMERCGETDEDGCFAAAGITVRGRIRFGINPSADYYGWREDISVNVFEPLILRTYRLRRRHPTRLIDITIDGRIDLPDGEPAPGRCRFDLLRRSFLPPYGTGTVSDVEFSVTELGPAPMLGDSPKDEIGEIFFPGVGNGGVLRKVPSDTDFVLDRIDESEMTNVIPLSVSRDCRLGFRIRSRFDGDGRLVDAHYGYIKNATRPLTLHLKAREPWQPCDSIWIGFGYCLNPVPGENNLESFGCPEKYEYRRISCPNPEKEGE